MFNTLSADARGSRTSHAFLWQRPCQRRRASSDAYFPRKRRGDDFDATRGVHRSGQGAGRGV